MEGALLERARAEGGAPCALGRDDERGALAQRRDRRAERLDRLLPVEPVDEDDAREREDGSEEGVAARLLLRHAGEVPPEELAEEEDVDRTLVIEDEDRGPPRPEMLLAAHGEADAGERGPELAPGGDREVHHVAPAPVQRAGDRTHRERREDAPDRQRRANDLHRTRCAARGEALDRPAATGGDPGEAPVGIGRALNRNSGVPSS